MGCAFCKRVKPASEPRDYLNGMSFQRVMYPDQRMTFSNGVVTLDGRGSTRTAKYKANLGDRLDIEDGDESFIARYEAQEANVTRFFFGAGLDSWLDWSGDYVA
jgi:hypothetical protein